MPTFVFWLVVDAVVFIVLFVVAWVIMPRLLRRRGADLVRTKFGPALVFESEDASGTPVRLLNVRGTFQSISYIEPDLRFELVCNYHRAMAQLLWAAGGSCNMVVIGGGGMSYPKYQLTHHEDCRVTVVEIDPVIVRLAREYFFVDELLARPDCKGRLNIVEADGWAWLRASGQRFDCLVNDAFSGKRPLGPLGTSEGAKLIHQHLAPGGVYLANVIAPLEGRASQHLYQTLTTFKQEFKHVYYIPEAPDEPRRRGNNALLATERELPQALKIAGCREFTLLSAAYFGAVTPRQRKGCPMCEKLEPDPTSTPLDSNSEPAQPQTPHQAADARDANGLTETEFLASYQQKDYPRPSLTADICVFRVKPRDTDAPSSTAEKNLQLLLIQRGGHPYLGCWALPGGFVGPDEDATTAAARELKEETGLSEAWLEPVGLYSAPGRDPRGWVVSEAFVAFDQCELTAHAGDDAARATWFDVMSRSYTTKLDGPHIHLQLSSGATQLDVDFAVAEHPLTAKLYPTAAHADGLAFDHASIVAQAWLMLPTHLTGAR